METLPSNSTEKIAKPRWMKIILVLVPAWLIVSGAFGLWLYFERQNQEKFLPNSFSTSRVTEASIASDFRILCNVIGPRHQLTAPDGLLRTAAMIDSALGSANTGFDVAKYEGLPDTANAQPFLHIRLAGGNTSTDRETPKTWVLIPYDAPHDSASKRGALSASSLTVALASAQLMVQQTFKNPAHFLFIPSIHSDTKDFSPTLKRLQTILGSANSVRELIYVGNMLHPGQIARFTIKKSTDPQSIAVRKDEIDRTQVDQFSPHLEICNSLSGLGYTVSVLESQTDDKVTAELLDQINPPAKILATHAESLRSYVESISK